MTFYYPFSAVWAGRSLLIATVEGELLLFESLQDVLEDWLPKTIGDDYPEVLTHASLSDLE